MSKTISPKPEQTDWIDLIREKVESLRFGVVQVVVHDGKVTQIERTEKTRLDVSRRPGSEDDSRS